jgi:hypothetical protein
MSKQTLSVGINPDFDAVKIVAWYTETIHGTQNFGSHRIR